MSGPAGEAGPPAPVLAAWGLGGARCRRVAGGLINQTWQLTDAAGVRFALQRVSAIFPPSVNADIAAVAAHLHARGMLCPAPRPTLGGALYLEHEGCWRLLDWIDGHSIERVSAPAQAAAAGGLLGRFHAGLADLDHDFRAGRAGGHDFARHRAGLDAALERHGGHHAHTAVAGLAADIDALGGAALAPLPLRICHGDPKITNVIFTPSLDEARCLVDLDTVGPGNIAFELGDALRSWCNPAGEDSLDTCFDMTVAAAALQAWAVPVRARITAPEWQAIPAATLQICLELAARFAADALAESYFGWDRERFASASEHNLLRARGQLHLAREVHVRQSALRECVHAAFDRN